MANLSASVAPHNENKIQNTTLSRQQRVWLFASHTTLWSLGKACVLGTEAERQDLEVLADLVLLWFTRTL